jgi:hypothetical protein
MQQLFSRRPKQMQAIEQDKQRWTSTQNGLNIPHSILLAPSVLSGQNLPWIYRINPARIIHKKYLHIINYINIIAHNT